MTSPTSDGKKTGNQDNKGRFVKGNRASPGRKPGSGSIAQLRAKMAEDLDEIVEVLRTKAKEGDPQSMRIFFDRVLPSVRPVDLPTPIEMPSGTLAEQAASVMKAMSNGEIAAGQAAQIVGALANVGKIIETTELIARIEALEKNHAKS